MIAGMFNHGLQMLDISIPRAGFVGCNGSRITEK
jgi:hypothetical protein